MNFLKKFPNFIKYHGFTMSKSGGGGGGRVGQKIGCPPVPSPLPTLLNWRFFSVIFKMYSYLDQKKKCLIKVTYTVSVVITLCFWKVSQKLIDRLNLNLVCGHYQSLVCALC